MFVAGDQNLINALNAAKRQLIVSRRYRTNDIREKDGECASVRVSSYQVIANVVDPVLTNNPAPPDQVNPPLSEPSTTIPPGSAIYLTLRVWGEVPGFSPEKVGAIVASQPDNPVGFPPPDDTDIPSRSRRQLCRTPPRACSTRSSWPRATAWNRTPGRSTAACCRAWPVS